MLVQTRNLRSRGCFACINRKVKCDERKPSCERCNRIQIQCPGYRHIDDLHFRNTLSLSRSSGSDLQGRHAPNAVGQNYNEGHILRFGSLPRPLVALEVGDIFSCGHEAKSLHYFRTCAAQDFQGYLRSEFWSSTIYQRSLLYPAIHHALLAVSDAHREWIINSSSSLSFATLTQYGKALRITITGIQADRKWQTYIVSLSCCILFYYFELINRNLTAAGVHLENGLYLLRDWHSTSSKWPPADLSGPNLPEFYQILYTIGRLVVDQSHFSETTKNSLKSQKLIRDGLRPIVEGPLNGFSLGCLLLLISQNTLHFATSNFQFCGLCISEVPREVLNRHFMLGRRMDRLLTILDKLQVQIDQTSMPARQKMMTIYTIRLYLISNRAKLDGMFNSPSGEIARPYDEYADQMLNYADMAASLHCEPPLRQGFLPEPGIIGPLKRLAHEVSHENIRCRAQTLIDRLSYKKRSFRFSESAEV